MITRTGAIGALLSTMLITTACTYPGAASDSGPARGNADQVQTRPNMLFILVDDMGYGDLSITGNDRVQTPNIDRLAKYGLLMTQFTVAAPITFRRTMFPATRARVARASQPISTAAFAIWCPRMSRSSAGHTSAGSGNAVPNTRGAIHDSIATQQVSIVSGE